jgi:hypothetical protein
LRGRCALRARSGAPTGRDPEVIHRPEKTAGLRCRFDGESFRTRKFEFRCRPALPGAGVGLICSFAIAYSVLDGLLSPTIRHRSSWSSTLADIFVQCPRTGAPVPTGLKTEWVLLKSLHCVAVPLHCPACGQMHKWKPDDAWIGSARPSGDANVLDTPRASLYAAAGGSGAKRPE